VPEVTNVNTNVDADKHRSRLENSGSGLSHQINKVNWVMSDVRMKEEVFHQSIS